MSAVVTPRARGAARIVLLLGGIAAGLAIAELALRVAYPRGFEGAPNAAWPWIVTDPVLGIRNRPGFANDHFRIDERGLRTSVAEEAHGVPEVRILCLGDSRTFGVWRHASGQRFDNDYPRLLEERIGSPRVEVLNGGVIGHTSSHGLRHLGVALHALRPDVVVVAYGVNDHLLSWEPALRTPEPDTRTGRWLLRILAPNRVFQLVLAADRRWGPWHPEPSSVPWTGLERYARNLHRFAQESRDRGFHLLFLWMPLRPASFTDTPPVAPEHVHLFGAPDVEGLYRLDADYRAATVEAAGAEGVPLVEMPGRPGTFGPDDFVHPTADGARLVADLLARRIRELGWLPSAESDPSP